jgi:alkylation response protein AidB-like acyl-CoA dehydrogenase
MSAVDAVARIGTADLGNEANDYRGHIREWISANGPAGLAAMIRWNAESYGSPERARALASPEYVEWERRLLDARLICPNWPVEYTGGGLTPVQTLVFAEECIRAGLPRVERGMGERMVGPAILGRILRRHG